MLRYNDPEFIRKNNLVDENVIHDIITDIKESSYDFLDKLQADSIILDKVDFNFTKFNMAVVDDSTTPVRLKYQAYLEYGFIHPKNKLAYKRSRLRGKELSVFDISENPQLFSRNFLTFIDGVFVDCINVIPGDGEIQLVINLLNGTDLVGVSEESFKDWQTRDVTVSLIFFSNSEFGPLVTNREILSENSQYLSLQDSGIIEDLESDSTYLTFITSNSLGYRSDLINTSKREEMTKFFEEIDGSPPSPQKAFINIFGFRNLSEIRTIPSNINLFQLPGYDLPIPTDNILIFRKTPEGTKYAPELRLNRNHPNFYTVVGNVEKHELSLLIFYSEQNQEDIYSDEVKTYYKIMGNGVDVMSAAPPSIRDYDPISLEYDIQDYVNSTIGESLEYKLSKLSELVDKNPELIRKFLKGQKSLSDKVFIDVKNVHPGPLKVRYIRDWLNGSTANTSNHWGEIQAIDVNGVNVALNKNVIGDEIPRAAYPYSRVVNGVLSDYGQSDTSGLKSVTVDLGDAYSLESVKIWHYYGDARTYHKTKTEVSEDGITWYTVFDSAIEGEYKETPNGRTYPIPHPGLVTRTRTNNINDISDPRQHTTFSETRYLFTFRNNMIDETRNVRIFVDGEFYLPDAIYAKGDFIYVYIPADMITVDSIIEIERFFISNHKKDFNAFFINEEFSIDIPEGVYVYEDIFIAEKATGKVLPMEQFSFRIQHGDGSYKDVIPGTFDPIRSNKLFFKVISSEVTTKDLEIHLKRGNTLHGIVAVENSEYQLFNMPLMDNAKKEHLRMFINGRLINPRYPKMVFKGKYKEDTEIFNRIYTYTGDKTVVDYTPNVYEQVLYMEQMPQNNVVFLHGLIDRPFDLDWYDIYVNGKKLNRYNVEIFTPYLIHIKNVESVLNVEVYKKKHEKDLIYIDGDVTILDELWLNDTPFKGALLNYPSFSTNTEKDILLESMFAYLDDLKDFFESDMMFNIRRINPDIKQITDDLITKYPLVFNKLLNGNTIVHLNGDRWKGEKTTNVMHINPDIFNVRQ